MRRTIVMRAADIQNVSTARTRIVGWVHTMYFLIIRCCIFVVRRKEEKTKARNAETAWMRGYPLVHRFHSGRTSEAVNGGLKWWAQKSISSFSWWFGRALLFTFLCCEFVAITCPEIWIKSVLHATNSQLRKMRFLMFAKQKAAKNEKSDKMRSKLLVIMS